MPPTKHNLFRDWNTLGAVIFTEWSQPKGRKNWTRHRMVRSYQRNFDYAKLWFTLGLGFTMATGLSLIPWLWKIGGPEVSFSPWQGALIAVSTLLILLGFGSFAMAAKFRVFYLHDDRKLDEMIGADLLTTTDRDDAS